MDSTWFVNDLQTLWQKLYQAWDLTYMEEWRTYLNDDVHFVEIILIVGGVAARLIFCPTTKAGAGYFQSGIAHRYKKWIHWSFSKLK